MSTTPAVNERLARLTSLGTAVWLDQIRRSLVQSGELERMVREDSLRGVTSNPAIFEKAILGSPDYDEQLERLAAEGRTTREVYRAIAVQDVGEAADVLRPVWDQTGGHDGFVSLEVDPDLAFDTDKTIEQAREYWQELGRPNVMIKIPGTSEGLPAIEQALYEGINVNVTLLFGVHRYEAIMEGYVKAMERRHAEGRSLDVHSVASFFVSRVDTEVDKRLEELGRTDLAGRAGLANARAAYQAYLRVFEGERFATLRDAGCPVQRPLWASTGTKNPEYSDVLYVEGLAGPNTVNTMPMPTLLAAADHGEFERETCTIDPQEDLDALRDAGIDLHEVTEKLLSDGVDAFVTPMEALLAGIETKREAIVTGRPETIESSIPDELEGAIAQRVRRAADDEVARRIWRRDDTLWGPAGQAEVADRLGWLTIAESLRDEADDLVAWAQEVRADGVQHVVLLGMGGSSLAPEVFRRSFGAELHVLDTTDPEAVRAAPLDGALFVVSSKSGGTVETMSAFHHFWEATGGDGSRFVAITDPGTSLEALGRERGFRRVFRNDPEIGGRYSALSYFGIVPAALAGCDVKAVLEGAGVAEQACAHFDTTRSNSGLWLGLALGELALHGRDKLTFVVQEPIASFGLWAEQLVAESLGKHGKGVLPVADEPLGAPEAYGEDRVVVQLRDPESPDEAQDEAVGQLAKAGVPVLRLAVHGPADLGRVMFFAEFATAVAGWVLEINPFDQPDVQSAKDATKRVLAEGAPDLPAADGGALRALLDAGPPSYLALQGYLAPDPEVDAAVAELRAAIRDRTRMTTTFGYGPRYLHSTGQLHKGGPPTGRFLQLVRHEGEDLAVPGETFSFGTLIRAQADGDLLTLRERGLPAERVVLEGDPAQAIRNLIKEL
ncbi:bifunctional transaldolase/phosoglucose isomerase [Conexibacter sp. SYSU D00693]|uniref:bifunctional transaldolase/phosoglucose isomerase n=1 Tax=Conexibacter sp. SYSU D00693 TaxID=2812560 RepID=UPI00196B7201|nr:bifunctional transaldolase/phosoglucose isomerase [Conexibacter sp. SYSU D00693]